MKTIRLLISQAVQFEWPRFQLDVKSKLLNGVLEEDVYIEQPPGYVKVREEKNVLKLKKVLHGLKQAPRAWNIRIDTYFKENEFKKIPYEHALQRRIEEFKGTMTREFEMTYLGLMKFFLGLEVRQVEKGAKFLKFDRGECVDRSRYRSLVGSLHYLTCTRSYLSLSVGIVSRFMEKSVHGGAGLFTLEGVEANPMVHPRNGVTRVVLLERRRLQIGWKKPIMTLSTCESEYVAASWCVCHAKWLRNLLSKMELKQLGTTVIHVDNKSTIELEKNPVNQERSKHIDVRFHFIRDHVKEGNVELVNVASQDQVADIFTKPLPKVLLDKCKKMIDMTDGRNI
ncbi:hypothetical protein F3Y22_tig00002193pilonHSYRG00130 [Hibiscus syriacus]|uniref:Reverse transcriptase Ty1/copia-type domain-containing protein n=1 Tax=Hibiscus syriacus TaxID=106335 RepID=A0A6A3CVA4_HIBSY|nr:hypothetical protein F3Y22_tig00002193pilonHSYRG00130 [Hibiscus syriacus]